jgi:gluconolactonase
MTDGALLAPGAELERVATGTLWAEGPVWLADRRVVRYSDIPNNRILEFHEDTGELTVYSDQAAYSNGRTLDLDGTVIQCSHGRRAVERDVDGRITPIVTTWRGVRLNSPNDVVVKSDGTIWFTDPSYGIERPGEGHAGELEYGDHYVFRFEPATGQLDPVVIDIEQPNGLAFSPDEKILYVADSRRRHVRAYDMLPNGTTALETSRLFVDLAGPEPGVPDGIKVDTHGNLYSGGSGGLYIMDSKGKKLGRIVHGDPATTNLAFGGEDWRTLYFTSRSTLFSVNVKIPGVPVPAKKRIS